MASRPSPRKLNRRGTPSRNSPGGGNGGRAMGGLPPATRGGGAMPGGYDGFDDFGGGAGGFGAPGGGGGGLPIPRGLDADTVFDYDMGGALDDGFLGLDSYMDPRETFTGDGMYNTQVYRGLLCQSDFQKVLINAIKMSQLFKETKDTLITIVAGLFDKTVVLARTKNLFLEYLDVQIILAQARIGFHPFDVDNPQLSNIMNMILNQYKQFASRSDQGWERGLQNKMETSHTSKVEQEIKGVTPQAPQSRLKKFPLMD